MIDTGQPAQVLSLVDEAASIELGRRLGRQFAAGGVLFLEGTLGAGKTTLTRGLLQYFGHQGAVKSPTYTLVEPYELEAIRLFHFDLYRLGDPEELEFMGIRDYFCPTHLCVLEWPVKGEGFLPKPDVRIALAVTPPGRTAKLSAETARGEQIIAALAAAWSERK